MFLSSLALVGVSPAEACGGFFCSNVPIEQEGEDILFGVDAEKNETVVHVQIAYTGTAEDFAWIVPVPKAPDVLLSNDKVFRELALRTQPSFQLQYEELFDCDYGDLPPSSPQNDSAGGSYSSGDDDDGRVDVVSVEKVGPYATAVLRADSATDLLDWLQENGYNLPDDLDPVLQPYVVAGGYFVALRLRKGIDDVGALQPIALKYPGTGASIPIQLTSIAATPDMRLHVYVAAENRSVPQSYLHVKINDLVVDWFGGGANYEQAVTVAADEAGGHAFATDYAGTSDIMDEVLWRAGQYDIPRLAQSPDAYAFFDALLSMGFVGDTQMLSLFREFLPMPPALVAQGVDEQSFYNDLAAYASFVDAIPFDPQAFADAIDERIVTPLRDAQSLFDRMPALSRLTSSVSPVEMTVDPTFVLNPDMEQSVVSQRSAKVQMLCGNGGKWEESPRRLILADGRSYDLPSVAWFRQAGTTEYAYLSDLMTNYAIVIEETGPSGQPTVLADHTSQAFADADAFNALRNAARTCGCNGATGGSAAGLVLAALGLAARRRRA